MGGGASRHRYSSADLTTGLPRIGRLTPICVLTGRQDKNAGSVLDLAFRRKAPPPDFLQRLLAGLR